MFSKSIRVVYLYVVAFIFLMVSIFSLVTTANRVAAIIFPEPNYCRVYDEWDNVGEEICIPAMRNWAIREAITSGVTFLISTGLFIYHWRAIEKERGNK